MGLCDGLAGIGTIANVLTWLKENATLLMLSITIVIMIIMLMRI